nr:hypothetical protein [uncultured Actinomyces sp.]
MDTQEITLNQDSDDGLYTQLLRGRYVTSINDGTITLDDGTELYIHGNEGCGGCESGWYWLEKVYKQGSRQARIMSAYVAYGEDDEDAPSVYTLFVMVDGNPTQLPLATVRGDNGNGYYGTGFTLTATVKPHPAPPLTVTPQDFIKVVAGEHPLPAIPDLRGREDLLNAVAYTLLQTRGFDSPLRVTGPEAQLFHKLTSNQYGYKGPYYASNWYGFKQTVLFWFTDMEGGVSLVLRNFSNDGAEAYVAKLRAFTERVRASKEPIKTFVTGYALKGNTATVNGKCVPATDFLLSEVCGFHGHRIGPEASFIPDWIFFHAQGYGVRVLKHRAGGRGDVTIYSESQSVWAVNPQKGTAS